MLIEGGIEGMKQPPRLVMSDYRKSEADKFRVAVAEICLAIVRARTRGMSANRTGVACQKLMFLA